MNINGYGTFVKKARQERGITQSQLTSGLCDISTLSRIERGVVTPTSYLRRAILERLGYYSDRELASFIMEENAEFLQYQKFFSVAILHNDYESAQKLITEISSKKDFMAGIGLQFLLNSKVIMATMRKHVNEADFDFEECMDTLQTSLSITIPNFSEDGIKKYLLTKEEIRGINALGGLYFNNKNFERSLHILTDLKYNLDNNSINKFDISLYYHSIVINIAIQQHELKRFDDAIETCETGMDFCIRHHDFSRVPMLLFLHARCLAESGNTAKAQVLLRESYHVNRAYRKHSDADAIAKYYQKKFNSSIDEPRFTTEHEIEHGAEHALSPETLYRISRLLTALGDTTLSAKELMRRLDLSSRSNFTYNYLLPAIRAGVIERTIPDSPKNSWQKYRKSTKTTGL